MRSEVASRDMAVCKRKGKQLPSPNLKKLGRLAFLARVSLV